MWPSSEHYRTHSLVIAGKLCLLDCNNYTIVSSSKQVEIIQCCSLKYLANFPLNWCSTCALLFSSQVDIRWLLSIYVSVWSILSCKYVQFLASNNVMLMLKYKHYNIFLLYYVFIFIDSLIWNILNRLNHYIKHVSAAIKIFLTSLTTSINISSKYRWV